MAKTNDELTKKIENNAPAVQQTKAVSHASVIRDELVRMKTEIARALPKHIDIDRLHRIILTNFSVNPRLYQCTVPSVLRAVMESAQLGLFPGITGEAYLIPYKNHGVMECQFQIGYKGMMKLARNSGDVIGIYACPVFKNDNFRIYLGTEQRIDHEMADGERGAFVGCYAVAKFKEANAFQFDYMTRKEIDAIWARSKAKNDGPWKTDYLEMAKKTVVKRLCKYLPLSSDVHEALEADAAKWAENDRGIDLADVMLNLPVDEESSLEVKEEIAAETRDEVAEQPINSAESVVQ